MRLSILLPTHNRADVLPFAIESVLSQTLTDFELLVVGDGCTDATGEIVAGYAARDKRVRWFDLPKAPNFGYANRNIALREARGELIGFMAHDDVNAPDHYRLLVQGMEDPAVHFAHTSAVWVATNGDMVPTVFHLEDSLQRHGLLEMKWNRLPATCFIHRRQAFADVGYWNDSLPSGGDMDLWGRIIRHYGAQSVRSLAHFTTFHFRAVWRTQEFICPDNEPSWLRLHKEPGRLSPWLKLPVASGQTEQEALAQRLRTQADAVENIAHACIHALMTRDWNLDAGLDDRLSPMLSSLSRQIEKLESRRVDLIQQRDALKEKLESRRADLIQQRDALKEERNRLKASLRECKMKLEQMKKRNWLQRLLQR